jgi:hypothetical protein
LDGGCAKNKNSTKLNQAIMALKGKKVSASRCKSAQVHVCTAESTCVLHKNHAHFTNGLHINSEYCAQTICHFSTWQTYLFPLMHLKTFLHLLHHQQRNQQWVCTTSLSTLQRRRFEQATNARLTQGALVPLPIIAPLRYLVSASDAQTVASMYQCYFHTQQIYTSSNTTLHMKYVFNIIIVDVIPHTSGPSSTTYCVLGRRYSRLQH